MRFKRASATVLSRVNAGYSEGLKSGGASFALIGGALALIFEPNMAVFGVAVISALVLGLISALRSGSGADIPPQFVDEVADDEQYSCQPCTPQNLETAVELVRPLFGLDNIDSDRLEQWRLKNPQGFMEITTKHGELIACFVVIGLEAAFMKEFIAGRVSEADIRGECVLDMRATKKSQMIYISGVVVKDAGTFLGCARARYLIWAMLVYIKRHFGFGVSRTFYAVPLTRQAVQLVKKFGFSVKTGAASRKDKHDFYELNLSESAWHKLLIRVGDFSGNCSIRYASK